MLDSITNILVWMEFPEYVPMVEVRMRLGEEYELMRVK